MNPPSGKRTSLLKPFPRRTAYADIHTAVRGASYHFHQLKRAMKDMTPLADAHGLRLAEVELFHWHLRAFFWELVAVRDILRRPRNPLPDASQELENERWFIEVNAYRNHTHESLHHVEVLIGSDGPITVQLQPAVSGQPYEADGLLQLERYWKSMAGFVEKHFPIAL